jgi:hypothetical protein
MTAFFDSRGLFQQPAKIREVRWEKHETGTVDFMPGSCLFEVIGEVNFYRIRF